MKGTEESIRLLIRSIFGSKLAAILDYPGDLNRHFMGVGLRAANKVRGLEARIDRCV